MGQGARLLAFRTWLLTGRVFLNTETAVKSASAKQPAGEEGDSFLVSKKRWGRKIQKQEGILRVCGVLESSLHGISCGGQSFLVK